MTTRLSPETVMACAIKIDWHAKRDVPIERVSGLFEKLRRANVVEVDRVALRKVPNGTYSEDVEAFFGRLLAGGFASASSPLRVNDKGIELCQELIDEQAQSHPQALEKVAQALGFDLSVIKSPIPQQTPA